jgi:hypothetical protein
MFRPALLLATLSFVACAAKHPSSAGPSAPAGGEAAESVDHAKIPDDAASKAFAQRLVKFDAKDFRPTDAPGAAFVYKTLDFRGDNTWLAMAQMSADGETVDCKEEGTWEMDPAIDDHTATMEWKLTRTSCAGRPENNVMRVKVGIEDGEYRIAIR